MIKTIGAFADEPKQEEYMALSFSPSLMPLKFRWKKNSLSADFLGDYLSNFFPEADADGSKIVQVEVRSAVSFIANELLENAMKFSSSQPALPITLSLYLRPDCVYFFLKNYILKSGADDFCIYAERLLNSDTHELYLRQIKENSKKDIHESGSRLGLLTMLNDYGAILGWQLCDKVKEHGELAEITTMVKLNTQNNT